ncbi:MAG: glycosyltransferase [Bacteroidales bacterium]|nr:glycosyltransferase [Bacteroidales bacterium]
MNLLFVNDIPFNPSCGGIERVTDMIVKELLRRGGYKITYLCKKLRDQSIMEYDYPVKVVTLPYEGGFHNLANITFYARFVKEYQIDIVINQRGWDGYMNDALDVDGFKTISVIHSTIDGWMNFMLSHINFLEKSTWGYIKYGLKQMIFPIYKSYKKHQFRQHSTAHYRELLAKSTAVSVLSTRYIDELKKYAGKDSCPIYAIHNPCSFGGQQKSDKENIILFVGRLTDAEKKPMRMIKIWEMLYQRHPDWRLIIVGDGDEREKMERYVNRRRIERVCLEGQQTEVDKYYKKASFICLTSQFEGWGMSLTEGMSFGCIPFTFDNYGAAHDIVDDNVNGCLIHAFDLTEYANRLSALMDNSSKREELSNAAREKSHCFSITSVVDKWEKLFEEVYKEL